MDFLTNNMLIPIWFGLAVFFLIVELAAPGLVSIWFVVGSIAALVGLFCGVELWGQIGLFTVFSILFLILTRPYARSIRARKIPTNADRVTGMTGLVKVSVDNLHGGGRALVDGLEWSAKSSNGDTIPKDTTIVVDKLAGNTLYVSVNVEE